MATSMHRAAAAATLALLAFNAPAQAQDVTNIANVRGVEEVYYGDARGWTVFAGHGRGDFRYCFALTRNDADAFRIGYDGGQWQIALPGRSARDWNGSFEVDGRNVPTGGTSDGQTTFVWLTLGDLDVIRNGQQFVMDVGRASIDQPLRGVAAAILKIDECVKRRGEAAVVAQAPQRAPQPAPQRPPQGLAQNTPPGGGGGGGGRLRKVDERPIGAGWQFARVMAGQRLHHCEVTIATGSEQGLRFAQGADETVYGFSGYGSASLGDRVQVRVWFDNKRNEATTEEAQLLKDANGIEWLSLRVSNEEFGGFHDLFANASRVSFGYRVDGRQHVESFALTSSNAASKALTDCATGNATGRF